MASFRTMASKRKPTTIRLGEELADRLAVHMGAEGIVTINAAINQILHKALPQATEKDRHD